MKSFVKILAVAAGVVGLVGSASAVPTLYLSDGVTSVTIADGSALDSNDAVGVVTYNGAVGINWTLNVTTGLSKPQIGSATNPEMTLNSVNANSKGAGFLTIKFSDDFFGPSSGQLVSKTGGTTAGTVSVQTYADASNALFGQGTLLTSHGPFSGGAFSDLASKDLSIGGPFSLTELATITHTRNGVTSFNEDLRVPDAGLTVALLGSSLIGLAAFSRSARWRNCGALHSPLVKALANFMFAGVFRFFFLCQRNIDKPRQLMSRLGAFHATYGLRFWQERWLPGVTLCGRNRGFDAPGSGDLRGEIRRVALQPFGIVISCCRIVACIMSAASLPLAASDCRNTLRNSVVDGWPFKKYCRCK